MDRYARKITLQETQPPRLHKADEEIAWLCKCLGMEPKKDRLAFEIFERLVEAGKKNEGVRSIEVSRGAKVTQAAVVYHINAFMRSGIIVKRGRKYFLRGGNLEETITELENDILHRMKRMREMARKIDEQMIR